MTKATIAEKDHQLAEQSHQLIEKDHQLAEKDKVIAEKDKQLLKLQTELTKFQQEFMESTKVALDRFLGFSPHDFLLQNFSLCQKRRNGDWNSNTFHSHTGGYRLSLHVRTKQTGSFMKVHLQHGVCSESFNACRLAGDVYCHLATV